MLNIQVEKRLNIERNHEAGSGIKKLTYGYTQSHPQTSSHKNSLYGTISAEQGAERMKC